MRVHVTPLTQIFLYRITHYRNLEFIFRNGLHCANCGVVDENFVNIGHKHLIARRAKRVVPIEPGGVLSDYVPFYFCKKAPMLLPIANQHVNDYDGTQDEIVYLITSVAVVQAEGLKFVFTDRHAALDYTRYYDDVNQLPNLDWSKINSERWGVIYDPTKQTIEVKAAEFLIHRHVPPNCIKAIVCATQDTLDRVQPIVDGSGFAIRLQVRPDYYY